MIQINFSYEWTAQSCHQELILSNILKQADTVKLRVMQKSCMAAVGQTGGPGVGLGMKGEIIKKGTVQRDRWLLGWSAGLGFPLPWDWAGAPLPPRQEQKKQNNVESRSSEKSVGGFIKLRLRFYLLLWCLPWWTDTLSPVIHLIMVISVYKEMCLNDVQKIFLQIKSKNGKNI